MPTSPTNAPAGVTTLPDLTTVSKRMGCHPERSEGSAVPTVILSEAKDLLSRRHLDRSEGSAVPTVILSEAKDLLFPLSS
jgi:hypothetical protein